MAKQSQQKMMQLNDVFSPSAPITSQELFFGRLEQINDTCDAINEKGQSFVIYGERGVGKTSLANIIATKLENVVVAKVTCNRNEDFKELWKQALSRVRFLKTGDGFGFVPEAVEKPIQFDLFALDQKETIDSTDILAVLEQVSYPLLLMFDEFDSIKSPRVRQQFADTIKTISDNAPRVTIGLVGIAKNISDLTGGHPSVERCIRQIKMPRMSRSELSQIVEKGFGSLGLKIEKKVQRKIVNFSSGFPHYTHLLAKFCAKAAIDDEAPLVKEEHLSRAINSAVSNVDQSIRDAYQKATMTSKSSNKFVDVLAACALADEDNYGTFSLKEIIEPYHAVTGNTVKGRSLLYNVNKLCEREKGEILEKVGESTNVRYRFRNPLMKVYVNMLLDKKHIGKRQRSLAV